MTFKEVILSEINQVMDLVDEEQVSNVLKFITKDKRIFITGAGRSGFQGKGFAMRLMHIGYQVFVMGETITPAIQKDDVWVAISGSGTTKGIVADSEIAKQKGLKVIAVTSEENSPLAKLADCIVIVPGATKTGSGIASQQLLSSLFDQTVHITLDMITLMLANRDNTSNEDAYNSHVNVE